MRVTWETFGRARAALDAGTAVPEVLATLTLSDTEWAAEQERLLGALDDERERGERANADAFTRAYREAWQDLTGELPFDKAENDGPAAAAPQAPPVGALPGSGYAPPAPTPSAIAVPMPVAVAAGSVVAATATSAPAITKPKPALSNATAAFSLSDFASSAALPFDPNAPAPVPSRSPSPAPTPRAVPIGETAFLSPGAAPSGPALPFNPSDRIPVERYAEITAILETEGNPDATFRRLGITTWNWLATVQYYSGAFAKDPALAQRFEALKKKAMDHAR